MQSSKHAKFLQKDRSIASFARYVQWSSNIQLIPVHIRNFSCDGYGKQDVLCLFDQVLLVYIGSILSTEAFCMRANQGIKGSETGLQFLALDDLKSIGVLRVGEQFV